jgi:hypothetical protein
MRDGFLSWVMGAKFWVMGGEVLGDGLLSSG